MIKRKLGVRTCVIMRMNNNVFDYFKLVINGLSEDCFGIAIPNPADFIEAMENHKEFNFKMEDDMWDSTIDGFKLVYVCCKGWVITFNNDDDCTEEQLSKLITLEKRLNDIGLKCSIKVLYKTCICT